MTNDECPVKSWFKFVTLKPLKSEARNPKSELENTRRRFVEASARIAGQVLI